MPHARGTAGPRQPDPTSSTGLRWPRRLQHLLLIGGGWWLFVWSWLRVTADRPEIGELRVLLLAAVLVVPVLTLWWVVHNVGIYRRKGPRKAVTPVAAQYTQDFNGRRIDADWTYLSRARRIDIVVAGGHKHFVAVVTRKAEAVQPAAAFEETVA